LCRAFVEADDREGRVQRLGEEIEHVFHPGHVLAVDGGHAPHLLLPGLDVLLVQSPPHCLSRDAVVLGEAHQLAGKKLQRPAASARWRLGASRCHQQRLFLTAQLALGTRARPIAESGRNAFLHKSLLHPVDGRGPYHHQP
jgi:hypothetical protein